MMHCAVHTCHIGQQTGAMLVVSLTLFRCPCRFTSGYINTCAYIMAPQLVPPALASKAGGAMALTFQVASLCALVAAWLIQLLMRRG